jgi:hypothetical protein
MDRIRRVVVAPLKLVGAVGVFATFLCVIATTYVLVAVHTVIQGEQ